MPLKHNMAAWNDLIKGVVDDELVPRAEAIAAACNEQSVSDGGHKPTTTEVGRAGYRAGTEGGKPLSDHDYRATVITATNAAMADNARNNRLVNNFHLGED